MSEHDSVLVIGSTGNVGGNVVAELLRRGVNVRAFVRDSGAADVPDGVELAVGDLHDVASLTEAVAGTSAVFLMWPFLSTDGIEDVVAAVGARRLVYLSSYGVDETVERQGDPIHQMHADIERAITASTAEWTMLRAGTFAANALGWAAEIRAGDTVSEAFGSAARAVVHERDLAAVAAKVLTEDGHAGARYVLTGPEPVTHVEQVRIIGEVLGRDVRFRELTPEAARQRMLDHGWPVEFADGLLGAWDGFERQPVRISPTVTELTGSAPRSFRDWVRDHAADFAA
ncbi:NmrA family NAD(P)-binding protein [Allokutzneria sp. A3M-2-11 16]|uniref:NmrA family NAD(P)-binding protein n=1 Tax=Allokutzneria sp. A3M-2-11 16 TaxID=2962043 RepID=UPI0020B827EC|nr:NmrA family NAD(P)-binding protein [Allokutzneria sp. A3M-2-11 16]MCP3802966.1 NmrA family NAD(P)-binding protein [Allokutzneria sp. A3M-2-11 16]